MSKYLFVAEKPSLCREIESAYKSLKSLGFDAGFVPLFGHFMELKEPDAYKAEWGKPYTKDVLPMIPDKFEFDVKYDVRSQYEYVKKLINSGTYDAVVNACDAGREGEAIFWSVFYHTGCKLPVKRLWSADTSEESLSKAISGLIDYGPTTFNNLRDSSFCRLEFDWLVGMNLSRAAMVTTHKSISVGRVKSPTLNIVVTRDLEIANFVPKDFFEIEGDFTDYKGGWFNQKTNATSFDNKADAEALVKKLGKKAVIDDVIAEVVRQNAPPLYSLTELQKAANRIYGFTAKETSDIAQSLYETHKILSYPRTESRALSTAMAKEIPDFLKAIKDIPEVKKYVDEILSNPSMIDAVAKNKKYVDNAKLTDHHALINTKVTPNMSKLTDKESKIFLLVIKTFVSIFLPPRIINKTTIITDVDSEKFKSIGNALVQEGYNEVWKGTVKVVDEGNILPLVKKGDTRVVKGIKVVGKKTKPPVPYTDDTLLSAMENAGKFVDDKELKTILNDTAGIGTQATRADTIEGLIVPKSKKTPPSMYRKGKTIRATDFGIETIKALDGKNVISPILTATWEKKLQEIEHGDITADEFRIQMINFIKDETSNFLNTLTGSSSKTVVGVCPKCGKPVISGKSYFMCSLYRDETTPCDFISSKTIGGETLTDSDFTEILKGNTLKEKTFKNKEGKKFKAKLALDNEKRVSYVFSGGNTIGKCPKCGGDIIDKNGSYACDNENCGFFISKSLKGTTITETDVKNLISGKSTSSKKFFSGKKPWFAKLKYSDNFTKLNFDFQKE